jgi:hypothetical protein
MNARPKISNPKRTKQFASQKDTWFDYYAGFSAHFVADAIRSIPLPRSSLILDPWNGSGTTTATAHELGFRSIGIDINPVMVVVARAKLLTKGVYESLVPLADELLAKASKDAAIPIAEEPLTAWLVPSGAATVRSIADAISTVLTQQRSSLHLYTRTGLSAISDLSAFYLVALFRTVRGLLRPFQATNPTWIKTPLGTQHRLRPSIGHIHASFRSIIEGMAEAVTYRDTRPSSEIRLGSSSALPPDITSVDAVISSPPYCTRIDYAVATKPELAILGCPLDTEFLDLRRRLIGGPVVHETQPHLNHAWGNGCLDFLEKVRQHPSKGSCNYYYKLFLQYFGEMHLSLKEISRAIKWGGTCVLVVQDSHYKTAHIDVARFLTDMASSLGWALCDRIDFPTKLLMARLNPRSRKYCTHSTATESVLWFEAS